MPRRRGDGPGHARACCRAQEAADWGLVADAVTEAHEAHAAAQHDPAGSARAFLSEATLPAVRALNVAVARTLLPAMHWIVNAVQPRLISPEAALYGHWMEWRTSNRSGRPPSAGESLQLTGKGSAMSLHNSAPALLHALRTHCLGDTAPYLNRGPHTQEEFPSWTWHCTFYIRRRGTSRWAKSWYLWKARTRRPPAPADQPGVRRRQAEPPYAVMCEAFPRDPSWCPVLPLATHAPRALANSNLSPPPSPGPGVPTTGGRSSGKSARAPPCSSSSSQPAGTQSGSWGSPPLTCTGQRPYPAPPSRRPRRRTAYTPSSEHRRSPLLRGST